MTFDGLLTFIALVVAALAFMRPIFVTRMQVTIWRWIAMSLVGIAAALYFEFFRVLALPCPALLGRFCSPLSQLVGNDTSQGALIDGKEAAFLVVLVWLLIAWWLLRRTVFPTRALTKLHLMVDRLALERRFLDLVDLIEPNLTTLQQIANRKLRRQRLHDWLRGAPTLPNLPIELVGEGGQLIPPKKPTRGERIKRHLSTGRRWCGRQLSRLVPSGERPEEAAADILRFVMTRREVLDHIVQVRHSFGAKLLKLDHYLVRDFASAFLTELVGRPGSALYEEIAASQNTRGNAHILAADAVILRALLDDAKVTQGLDAYRPIAERALANLDPGNAPGYVASLNLNPDVRFDEFGKWDDPTFISIQFFVIMIPAAAEQGITWHMWLVYMMHFVRKLAKVYDDTGPDIDPEREWPTRNAYLIYSAFSALTDWIELGPKLPPGSPHRSVNNHQVDWENGNIPKTATIVLGECLGAVVMSDAIGRSFQRYLLDIALRSAVADDFKGDMTWLRTVTFRSLAQGGITDKGDEYRNRLCDLYADLDPIAQIKYREFEVLIGWPAAFPITSP